MLVWGKEQSETDGAENERTRQLNQTCFWFLGFFCQQRISMIRAMLRKSSTVMNGLGRDRDFRNYLGSPVSMQGPD